MWISVLFSVTKLKYSPLYQWEHGQHKSRNHKEEDMDREPTTGGYGNAFLQSVF